MKIALRIALMYSVALLSIVTAREGTIATPENFKISLEPEKTKFFLGEFLLIHYRIDNLSETPFDVEFGGDRRATVRSTRFKIKAIDKDAAPAPDPFPYAEEICRGGGVYPAKVTRGTPLYQSLDLSDFARIDKPGKYTIEVYHDLGWAARPPKAVAEIEFVVPTTEEAEKIARETLNMKNVPWPKMFERGKPNTGPSALARPEYLPILKTLAREGKSDALKVIELVATPEATQALIELTDSKDAALMSEAARLLSKRLPFPPGERKEKDFYEVLHNIEPWRKMLIRTSWRAEYAPAVRKIGTSLMESPENREIGEYILKCVGTGNGK